MKRRTIVVLIAALCLGLSVGYQALSGEAQMKGGSAAKKATDPIITVLNPLGTPPPIELKPMAPRLDTIEGKTIYLVDDGYPGSENLLLEMQKGFGETYPRTSFHYVKKRTFMAQKDPELWAEMQKKADAMVIALGH